MSDKNSKNNTFGEASCKTKVKFLGEIPKVPDPISAVPFDKNKHEHTQPTTSTGCPVCEALSNKVNK